VVVAEVAHLPWVGMAPPPQAEMAATVFRRQLLALLLHAAVVEVVEHIMVEPPELAAVAVAVAVERQQTQMLTVEAELIIMVAAAVVAPLRELVRQMAATAAQVSSSFAITKNTLQFSHPALRHQP
jgi:hypothetical protein